MNEQIILWIVHLFVPRGASRGRALFGLIVLGLWVALIAFVVLLITSI